MVRPRYDHPTHHSFCGILEIGPKIGKPVLVQQIESAHSVLADMAVCKMNHGFCHDVVKSFGPPFADPR